MNIEEVIALIKTRLAPSVMRSLLATHNTQVINVGNTYISVEGKASGNFRIQTRAAGEIQLFVLGMRQFEEHPLKVNQWK